MLFDDLDLIPLDLPRTGFTQFLSTWLLNIEGHHLLVDPGPAYTIPHLLDELGKRGISTLEGILLTHIHIDHAGGLNQLLRKIPVQWIHCHKKAVKHLIDPTALWKGSLKVLGDLAELYGEMRGISEKLLRTEPTITVGSTTIQAIETPGHAPHHQSFIIGPYLFVGEAAGCYQATSGAPYMRPATPPKFKRNIFVNSLFKLLHHPDLPDIICYAHYGMSSNAREQLTLAFHQVDLWNDTVLQMHDLSNEEIFRYLLQVDPVLTSFYRLTPEQQKREQYFVNNTLDGMKLALKEELG